MTATTEAPQLVISDLATRRLPWAGLVTGSAEPGETLTSSELVVRAGLDWEVGIRPLYRRMFTGAQGSDKSDPANYEFIKHPTARETFRSTDQAPLGVVRGHYQTFSNLDVFAFGDGIVESGQGHWTDAGIQFGGKRVFMSMLLNEFEVLGQDPYRLYLFLQASHDGSTSLNAYLLPFRVECTNLMGLVNASNLGHWNVLHVSTIREKATKAQLALAEAVDYETEFRALAERLAAQAVSDQKVRSVINRAVPVNRNRRDDVIADIRSVYENSLTVEPFKGTAYGLLNAVTEYYDHIKPQRNPNARFQSIMLAEGAKARASVLRDLAGLN